jgi:type I restriction-modification system DNA methylase subunit
MEYSQLSKDLTNKISKPDKKKNGIYFTPPSCVAKTINILRNKLKTAKHVLEPSFGSGEYITAIHREFPNIKIDGVEYFKPIYDATRHIQNDMITLYNMDFLDFKSGDDTMYDLVIANPPYYVMKKQDVDKQYHPYFDGRPNIFILFLIKSERQLKPGGIMSFILPKNFLNCLYYDKTRKFIVERFDILHILECVDDKYIETEQDTINLFIQKKNSGSGSVACFTESYVACGTKAFILENSNNPYTIFTTPDVKQKITKLYENSSSLYSLGFKVSVGNVVWNQCKDILTDDATKTRLIYSSDIQDNTLIIKKYTNDDKKNYINKPGTTRPMIVINRGYGVGQYKFNFCIIDEDNEYLVENHLICIESSMKDISREMLLEAYKKIVVSLNDERTSEFISIYFGNNAINTTELNHILPIYGGGEAK